MVLIKKKIAEKTNDGGNAEGGFGGIAWLSIHGKTPKSWKKWDWMSEEVQDRRIARGEKQQKGERQNPPRRRKAIRLRFAKALPKRRNTAQSWT